MTEQIFNYTGAVQNFVVPDYVFKIKAKIYGAEGRIAEGASAGKGGYTEGSFWVTPGETLKINVGGQPTADNQSGWNGGGLAFHGGGGASDVRGSSNDLGARKVVAGGGAGSGNSGTGNATSTGGDGGGTVGEDGGLGPIGSTQWNGKGGTSTTGGASASGPGSFGQGGGGGSSGGGGGWYGGGSGQQNAGGGGGSSKGGEITSETVMQQGVRSGNGLVTLEYDVNYATPQNINLYPLNTNLPTVSVDLINIGQLQRVGWELSMGPNFLFQETILIEEDELEHVLGNKTQTEQITIENELSQGLWYVRAYGFTDGSPPKGTQRSDVRTFTISHPPSAVSPMAPMGGVYVSSFTPTLTWTFSDLYENDEQSAYQVIIERNSNGSLIHDSGKIVSSNKFFVSPNLSAYTDVQLRWKVRVWDAENVVGSYSLNNIFLIGGEPTVTITYPAESSVIDDPLPTTIWGNTFPDGSRTQDRYRVKYTRDSDGALVYDSGWVNSSATNHVPGNQILEAPEAYTVEVSIRDSVGLQDTDANSFTTAWDKPAGAGNVGINVFVYDIDGYIGIEWNNSQQDVNFYSYRVYRRQVGDISWKLLYETIAVQANYSFHDYTTRSQTEYEYSVVQVTLENSAYIESIHDPVSVYVKGTHYWLINETNPTESIKLYHITDDSYTEEYEQAQYVLLGRGRHFDFGSRLGVSGSLSAEIRNQSEVTAREQRQRVEMWKASHEVIALKTPFGDYWPVVSSNMSFSRVGGVGVHEMGTLTIPYHEVIES